MIGWIALAGIIVRNSILLVDFSIHEVQKGVPVAESVIRACKTRTRPILITALALVAGSSVIFTDPIFQGMAISLASGVLVSTVLTLIVIPLGCVAASRDLCEVASATAPPGMIVPCSLDEQKPAPKEKKAKSSRGSILIGVWGRLVEAFVMVFYLVRGIFLLLFDLVKNLFKKKSTGKQTPPPPKSGSTPPKPGPGGSPPAGPTPGKTPGAAVPAVSAEAETATALRTPSVTSSTAAKMVKQAATVTEGTRTVAQEAKADSGRKSDTGSNGGKGASAEAPAAKAPAKKASAAKAPAKKAAARKTTAKKTAAKKKVAAKQADAPKMALVQKKAPRRGIRLKVDGGQGPGFD
jgi:hypothetical protein